MLEAALQALNASLRTSKRRVQIVIHDGRLYLRATVPSKRDPAIRTQSRIPLSLDASLINLGIAENRALELSIQLSENTFTWAHWITTAPGSPRARTHDQALAHIQSNFQAHYARKAKRPDSATTEWKAKWISVLRRLPTTIPITQDVLEGVILSYPEASAPRSTAGYVLAKCATWLGLDPEPIRSLSRGYSSTRSVHPRDIPEDDAITTYARTIRAPHWRWLVMVCATYGIRPHEAAEAQFDHDFNLIISDATKTGYRLVWPCLSEWVTEFALGDGPWPQVPCHRMAHAANLYLRGSHAMPFHLYDLRHAYAVRLLRRGVSSDIGARLMGHSPEIHHRTYRRWTTPATMAALRNQYSL